jgi:hypothetical protein
VVTQLFLLTPTQNRKELLADLFTFLYRISWDKGTPQMPVCMVLPMRRFLLAKTRMELTRFEYVYC